jgi:hypothetical protein
VGDEEQGQLSFLLEITEQCQHLGLDHQVECRGWLIGNEKMWIARQGHRNQDSLTLTT